MSFGAGFKLESTIALSLAPQFTNRAICEAQ
jgi:hypothetical protein